MPKDVMAIQLAAILQLHPRINANFFTTNINDIKLLQHKDNYSIFPRLGEDFGKFAFEFGFVSKVGIYPTILEGKNMRRYDLRDFNGEQVVMFTQSTEQHLPSFATLLKFVNVLSITHWLDETILKSSDVRFSTENVATKGLPANYFMLFENYQKFVYGKFEFDDDPAPLSDFKKVHPIPFFHSHFTHYFLSLGPVRQVKGFRRI